MVGEVWPKIKVDDLIRRGVLALNDGYRVRNVELGPVGIPFVRGGDIGDGDINTAVEDHIRPEFADRVQSKLTQAFDVAFITKGTVGRVGMLRPHQPASVFAPQVCYWRSLDIEQLEPRFLFFLLRSAEFQANLDAVKTHGSMVADYVSMSDQRLFSITLPPIRAQRSIAAVLGALDDKIELNRRMNTTLEAMTHALFQSWFVDLDTIPKGWGMGRLGDIATNPRRGIDPSTLDPSTPYIGLEHMPRRSIALGEWGHAEELESNKFEFRRGELLFGKLRPYFHKVGVAPIAGICSTDILVVCPATPEWFGFLLGHISSVEFINHTEAASGGTKMPRTSWQDMARYEIALPPKSLAEEFTALIRPAIERIAANAEQSRTLAALRDTLLPKLLSGELRADGPLPS